MTTSVASSGLKISDPAFWRRPLNARMADFAVLREQGPFVRARAREQLSPASPTSSTR